MQVEKRLEGSLHNRVYIVPDQEKNPTQVEDPSDIYIKVGSKPKSPLPKNTRVIDVFDEPAIGGRLLILGKPAVGKTTMLLQLAKSLLKRVENDLSEPLPVLFSLSAWRDDKQSIGDWLVAEFQSKYGVRRDIAKQWLDADEIIPLLDGLDELAGERQEGCVKEINEFLQPGNWNNPLVVCSRSEEYQVYLSTGT